MAASSKRVKLRGPNSTITSAGMSIRASLPNSSGHTLLDGSCTDRLSGARLHKCLVSPLSRTKLYHLQRLTCCGKVTSDVLLSFKGLAERRTVNCRSPSNACSGAQHLFTASLAAAFGWKADIRLR